MRHSWFIISFFPSYIFNRLNFLLMSFFIALIMISTFFSINSLSIRIFLILWISTGFLITSCYLIITSCFFVFFFTSSTTLLTINRLNRLFWLNFLSRVTPSHNVWNKDECARFLQCLGFLQSSISKYSVKVFYIIDYVFLFSEQDVIDIDIAFF